MVEIKGINQAKEKIVDESNFPQRSREIFTN
jgi:hypothetical protein